MATEETAATNSPGSIRTIIFHSGFSTIPGLTVEEVMIILRALKPNEKVDLKLCIHANNYDDFNRWLRFLILEKKRNINHFKLLNAQHNNNNYFVCLDFFIQFILDNNETTHYEYSSNNRRSMNLECSRLLAEAIRSNNHGQIEKFTFMTDVVFTTHEGIQLVWDSLLEAGVQVLNLELELSDRYEHNINNNVQQQEINLESFSTNTTLQELTLDVDPSVHIDWTTFFGEIKVKKELESLEMHIHNDHFRRKEVLLVEDMLRENNSLTITNIYDNYNTCNYIVSKEIENDEVQNRINNLLNINYDWKTYKAMDDDNDAGEGVNDKVDADADADADAEVEGSVVVVATANKTSMTTTMTNNKRKRSSSHDDDDDANAVAVAVADADADATANEENTNLTFKKRTLVRMFVHKPIMRDIITFILVNEYKLALIQDAKYIEEGNEHGIILRPITVWW